jgi:hypothetical protein
VARGAGHDADREAHPVDGRRLSRPAPEPEVDVEHRPEAVAGDLLEVERAARVRQGFQVLDEGDVIGAAVERDRGGSRRERHEAQR